MDPKSPETPDTGKHAKPDKPAAAAPKASRAGALSSGLALILSIIALLGTAYTGYTYHIQRGLIRLDTFTRLDKLEAESETYAKADTEHHEQLNLINETQETLKTALDKLNKDLGKGRADWMLAETEQLLLIANNRLQLARDVRLAIAALRAADRQLQQLADPAYLPVRKLLAEEINNLEAVERVDVPGWSLRLANIAARVDRLPILPGGTQVAAAPAPAPDAGDDGDTVSTAREMWNDLIGLVSIRRSEEIRKPLLLPEQHYFLRENLRLMLYGAQIALLQSDTATFETNLKTARQWITQHYDSNAVMVQEIVTDLDEMLKARLSARLPDISRSLELLRRISAQKAAP
ncbi:MAG TPA: uroporphyrinogen-III C-methyltransferase [Acidiferrobacterales bacterium]